MFLLWSETVLQRHYETDLTQRICTRISLKHVNIQVPDKNDFLTFFEVKKIGHIAVIHWRLLAERSKTALLL